MRQIQHGAALPRIALARDGTIYAFKSHQDPRYPGEGRYLEVLEHLSATGRLLWKKRPVPAFSICGCLLVHGDGAVSASNGKGIDTYSASGRLLWRLKTADGALALAER